MRTIEVLKDGIWSQVRMKDLHRGDRFRISGDELCPRGICTAESEPFLGGPILEPVWTIYAEALDLQEPGL